MLIFKHIMKTRIIYLLLMLSFIAKAEELPNVLYIVVDQHSGLFTNQAGYSYATIPGVDKLANDGTFFRRSYCSYPVCTQSRKSLVAGDMPSKLDDVTNHISIGTQFKNKGYETVFYGKWHVGSTEMDEEPIKTWHGFDTYIDGRVDSDIYKWSSAFLKSEHEKPFFMVTSFLNPHDCCELARNIAGEDDSYHDGAVEENADTALCPPLPFNFAIPKNEAEGFYTRRNNDPGENYWDSQPTKLWKEVEWRQYMYGYDRLVEKVDQHVENLYDDLVDQGLLDNTIVVFTSDHGDGHAIHQWTQKKSFYEESVNVPLIFFWKGKIHSAKIDEKTLVSGLDIYPTLLSLVGITPPSDLPGRDLSPALLISAEDTTIDRDYVVSEIIQKVYNGNTPGSFYGRMVVNQDYKYILFDKGVNREQLFDLNNDPGELEPVTDDVAYQDIITLCRNQLKDWVTTTNDDFDVDDIISEFEASDLLDAVLLNDEKIESFNPSSENQVLYVDVDVDFTIGATAVNSAATVSIIQPTDIEGDEAARTATISVTSEDLSTSKVYTVVFEEKPSRIEFGFDNTAIDNPEGWSSSYCLISESINGPGNHGLYDGNAALKFVRGQAGKAGFLSSSFYDNMDSVSFWLYVYKPTEEGGSLKIETITASEVTSELVTIQVSELAEDAWTEFKFPVTTDEMTQLLFTPSLPTDGSTRIWMDDLTLYFKDEVEGETGLHDLMNSSSISLFPNPCSSTLNITTKETGKLSIYDITGEVMLSKAQVSDTDAIDISDLDVGIYILEIQGESTYLKRFVKN